MPETHAADESDQQVTAVHGARAASPAPAIPTDLASVGAGDAILPKPPQSAVEKLADLYSAIDSSELRRAASDVHSACQRMRVTLCVRRGEWPTYDAIADLMGQTAETLAAEAELRIRAAMSREAKP